MTLVPEDVADNNKNNNNKTKPLTMAEYNTSTLRKSAEDSNRSILNEIQGQSFRDTFESEEAIPSHGGGGDAITAAPWAQAGSGRSVLMSVPDDENQTSETIDLTTRAVFHIGRNPVCDIVLQSKQVSRSHALLFHDRDGNCYVTDQNSTRGTKINGENIGTMTKQVPVGSTIHFSDSRFKLVAVGVDTDGPDENPEVTLTQSTENSNSNSKLNPSTLTGNPSMTQEEIKDGAEAVNYICSKLGVDRSLKKTPSEEQLYILKWMGDRLMQDIETGRRGLEEKRAATSQLEQQLQATFFRNSWIERRTHYHKILRCAVAMIMEVEDEDVPLIEFEIMRTINFFRGNGSDPEVHNSRWMKVLYVANKLYKVVRGVPAGRRQDRKAPRHNEVVRGDPPGRRQDMKAPRHDDDDDDEIPLRSDGDEEENGKDDVASRKSKTRRHRYHSDADDDLEDDDDDGDDGDRNASDDELASTEDQGYASMSKESSNDESKPASKSAGSARTSRRRKIQKIQAPSSGAQESRKSKARRNKYDSDAATSAAGRDRHASSDVEMNDRSDGYDDFEYKDKKVCLKFLGVKGNPWYIGKVIAYKERITLERDRTTAPAFCVYFFEDKDEQWFRRSDIDEGIRLYELTKRNRQLMKCKSPDQHVFKQKRDMFTITCMAEGCRTKTTLACCHPVCREIWLMNSSNSSKRKGVFYCKDCLSDHNDNVEEHSQQDGTLTKKVWEVNNWYVA